MIPGSQSYAYAGAMKRYEIWLGVVLGITCGLMAGFYLGRSFPHEIGNGEAVRKTEKSSQTEPGIVVSNSREIVGASENDWAKSYVSLFEKAVESQPTPGLTEAIMDALRAEAPFDEARMLLLIEMMRKEDFPIALEVLRKAKTHIRDSLHGEGPAMWIAFWKRFGERDPATALAKALECGDLDYANRNRLEHDLFRGMALNNPRAAAAAYLAHSELPNVKRAVGGLMLEWIRTDPGAASEWARQSLEGDDLNAAFDFATSGITSPTDIAAGNEFAKSLPDGPAKTSALRSLKNQILHKPSAPAQQILAFVAIIRESATRDHQFEMQMAARCTTSDPMAAANFFSQPLPGDAENDFAELKIVSAQWFQRDPKQAENWAKGQEGTPHYEAVAGEFARAAQERNDEAGAQRWLDAIAAQRKGKPPR